MRPARKEEVRRADGGGRTEESALTRASLVNAGNGLARSLGVGVVNMKEGPLVLKVRVALRALLHHVL